MKQELNKERSRNDIGMAEMKTAVADCSIFENLKQARLDLNARKPSHKYTQWWLSRYTLAVKRFLGDIKRFHAVVDMMVNLLAIASVADAQ